jgi:hypothetical protein
MSTVIEDPASTREWQPADRRAQHAPTTLPDGSPNLALLEDKLPPALKASKALAIFTAALGLIYFCLNRLAVRHTDVWGHLAYGRWMVEHGRIPETEPLLLLSQGVPWVDTAWLGKLSGYWMFEWFGLAGLQMIHGLSLTIAFALLAWGVYRITRSVPFTLIGLLAFGLVDYQQILIHRPQDIALACFVATLVLAMPTRLARGAWIVLPLVFAVWANFHGSFPVGLLVLGAIAAGRAIDLFRRTRNLRLALRSRLVWRPLLLLELCAAAALLNPRGLGIYADVLAISRNPNLPSLVDWAPLTFRMFQGQALAVAIVALFVAYRCSPRRATASEVLLLLGLGGASLWTLRMIIWFGPVVGYCLALHGAAAWRRRKRLPVVVPPSERRGLWSVATVGLAWIFFAYTPFGLQRIHGRPQGKELREYYRHNVTQRTPLDAVEYVREQADELPGGLMYNSHEWGDYVQWAAPEKFRVFVNSHVHLIPREVWEDYLLIHGASGPWEDKLDRYGVNTVLVDTTNYAALIYALRNHDGWREAYRDPQGLSVLFVRKQPV